MLILPITRSWICSTTARRVYTVCAILALVFVGTMMGTRAAQAAVQTTTLPPVTDMLLTIVWIPGIAGSALLWVAMFYFWFGFDPSHWLSRALWFLALFFFAPLGPALYCLLVYRKYTSTQVVAPAPGAAPL